MTEPKPCKNCQSWSPLPEDKLVGLCTKHQEYRLQLETCPAWLFGEQRPTRRYTYYDTTTYEQKLIAADAACDWDEEIDGRKEDNGWLTIG